MAAAEVAAGYLEACVFETQAMTNAEKVALALVHATLAVAEQQHIANLTARWAALTDLRPGEQLTPDGRAEVDRLNDMICEGLGLE